MSEVKSRWFVKEDNCSVILRRKRGWRQSVMVSVENHSGINMIPILGISIDGVNIIDTIRGDEIVPKATTIMTIPAEDANGVLFEELYIFLYYATQGVSYGHQIQNGLEYNLLQASEFNIFDFYAEGCSVLSGQLPISISGS